MGVFDILTGGSSDKDSPRSGAVDGPNKKDGGHDHRYNTGKDRTPSQKEGDKKRSSD